MATNGSGGILLLKQAADWKFTVTKHETGVINII